ncbi:SH3 domain-containing protein [Tabrizicola sp.]|uniref:SH3 domain-containing protein n=1 Tax=Tabrizicola sp. TaxID=2005166 RepID=UPI0025F4EEE2|nr:SH3 domain-containing protein [Tabrizicola sp.]
MLTLRILAVVLAVGAGGVTAASAQDRTERVTFAAGATGTIVSGTIRGERGVKYVLGASKGQRMSVDMATSNTSAYFNIRRSGSDEAVYIGSVSGNSTTVTLPSGGDWVVQVYLTRNAARRGEVADYRLSISIEGRATASKPPAGGGDADASGPDWWAVAGVGAGDLLNVREGPSTRDRIMARVGNGTILRNGGCVGEGRARWCKVSAPDGSFTGWASGGFLRESGAPASGSTPALALLPELCRSAVAVANGLPIRSLTAYPPQPAGRGYEVFVQSTATTREFNCRFGPKGKLLGID